MKKILLVAAISFALAACGGRDDATPATTTAASAPSPAAVAADHAKQLAELYEAYWEENLKLNPLQATQIGDPRYNDLLPNSLSPEYKAQETAFYQRWLDRAKAIGDAGLDGQDKLSYDIFVRDLAQEVEGAQFPTELLPINQFYNIANFVAMYGSGENAQPFKTVADYDHWVTRAGQVPALFDQAIVNMRAGMAKGIVQPKVLMAKVLPQLDQVLVDAPEKSIFWGPIRNLPADFTEADKARLTAAYTAMIDETLLPSYRKLRDFIASEYLPACRDTVGLGALPGGDAWYAFQVRRTTTTDLAPEQIHQIGVDEVARLQGEMRKLMPALGVPGDDLKQLYAKLKADPKMYFGTEDEMLTAYRDFRATVDPLLPTLFDIQPKADFEIRAVEAFRAQSASSGSYNAPSQDGTRPGIFYANTYDLKARPKWTLEALYLHEATPGHHFQIALQRELPDLPKFRRFGGETAFSEGWGLYSESIGQELGVYTDPVMAFGALEAELWRAIRLVTDTGIHAKGWTRQQVLDYMYANSPAEETRAVAEAERFMAIPGQALAYKIGQLKIRELRAHAEKELGDRFDVRAFHREVLRDGSLPLGILAQKIDRWIADQKKA